MNRVNLLLPLLAAVLTVGQAHAGADRPGNAVSAQGPAQTLSAKARGEAIAQFVRRWGPYVEQTYGTDVATWSQRMVPQFSRGDALNVQKALTRTTFEGAMAELGGVGARLSDSQAINLLAQASVRSDGSLTANALGSLNSDLVYTAVAPCRIVDTRVLGGVIAANSSRNFLAWGVPNYTQFGGSSTDCGMASDHPAAVLLNVTMVTPANGGYATVYGGDLASPPLVASINYAQGATVNNSVVSNINPVGAPDYKIYTFAASHVVVDLIGYFAAPKRTDLTCADLAGPQVAAASNQQKTGFTPTCLVGSAVSGGVEAVTNAGVVVNALTPDGSGNSFFYSVTNGGTAQNFTPKTRCCSVPGR